MSESMVERPMIPFPKFRLDPSWLPALKTPLVIALGAALLVQLVLALLLGGGSGMAPVVADTRLLPFDETAVTGIEIQMPAETDGDAPTTLKLIRASNGWTLPDLGDFPASGTRVQQLFDSLAGLTRPLPVATSADAQRRFKVADDAFERRLTLRGGDDELATLIVGDSPGFRRVFARVAGEDAVYDLRLALFDLSANNDDWLDRGRLQLDREKIQRIAGADWTLMRGEDGWQLEGSAESPDADAVDDLLSSLTSLGYSGVLGTDAKSEYGLDTPAATFAIGLADGTGRRYRIGALADSDDYVLKLDDDPYFYRLAAFELSGLLELTTATLLGNDRSSLEPDPVSTSTSAPLPDPASPPAPGDPAAMTGEEVSPASPKPVAETASASASVDTEAESAAESSAEPAEVSSRADDIAPAQAGTR